MAYFPKRDDPEINVPQPCKTHPQYGGLKLPTSGCRVCEMFYWDRKKAVAHVKALLRLLDRYGVIYVDSTISPHKTNMHLQTPKWMTHGRRRLKNNDPKRRRYCDGYLQYNRLRF